MILPAISLWRPWSSACLVPELKVHETRHWPAPARVIGKRIVIHAAAKPIPSDIDEEVDARMADVFGADWRRTIPRGAFIGTATLASCGEMGVSAQPAHRSDGLFGNWFPGRFAWRLADPRAFAEPIPAKGLQGWFKADVPDEVAA